MGGILVRKECWTLSVPAKLLIAVACAVAMLAAVQFIHPFLTTTDRVHGEFLVVEGWVPTYALTEATVLFNGGGYRKVLTSGCTISDEWIKASQAYSGNVDNAKVAKKACDAKCGCEAAK